MSFRQVGPWNQHAGTGSQYQHPYGLPPPPQVGQHNNFSFPQPNTNSGQPWEHPPPDYFPHSQSSQFSSNHNVNTLNMPYPPQQKFATKLPPPGPPPPRMVNSFSTPPPNIPPPPIQTNSSSSFNTESGGPPRASTMQTFPHHVHFEAPPPPVFANNLRPFPAPSAFRNPPPFAHPPFPSPSMSISPNSFQSKSESQKPPSDKAKECQKLEQWLKSRNKKQNKSEQKLSQLQGKSPLKVWDFMNRIKEMHKLINNLGSQVDGLSVAVSTSDDSTWETSKRQCDSLKEKLTSNFGSLLKDDHLEEVHNKLSRIRHKRMRMRRARAAKAEDEQVCRQLCEEKSKSISRWQERLRAKIREENNEKKRKAAADRTLSKVTREIHDATRLIDTMLALEKLRLIRRDAAQKRGDSDIGESRQSFEEKIKDMTRLVKAQLECYREEEAKLKQVLKTEEEEKSKLECQDREDKARMEQEEDDKKLKLILFGQEEEVTQGHPLLPFNQFYKQATYNSSAFLQIRQEWDTFLVPMGTPASSCIPSSWVTPDPPSSSVWASALQ